MMFKLISYTWITVLTVDLLATSGDITLTWTSPMLPKLYSNDSDVNPFDRPITAEEDSWIGSLLNMGAMIGPLPFGFIAERFGRKKALLCIAVPHIASYLTLAFSRSLYLYYFARLLGGIAVGGGYTILPMYIGEVSEDSNRGTLSVTLNVFWTFGNLLPYVLGPYIPIVWFNIILACVPATFFILFLLTAPETPYYLVSKNRLDEAKKSLMTLRSSNEKAVENEIAHIQSGLEHSKQDGNFLDLFKTKVYLKALGISLVLIIGQQLSGIDVVFFYTQKIFEAAGDNIPPDISSIIVGLVTFVTSFSSVLIADRWGRKPVLLISCLGAVLALVSLGVYFYLKQSTQVDVNSISWLPLVSLIVYMVTYTIGIGPLPWTLSSELFPTNVKSLAASIISLTGWTTSFLVVKFFNAMNDGMGQGGPFWLFGSCCAAFAIFTFFYVPETKGKSFEEIQELLEK